VLGVTEGHWKWHHLIDHTTSYQSSIVSIAVSCTIFDTYDVNTVNLKFRLWVTCPANLFTSTQQVPEIKCCITMVIQGHLRVGTNWKPICDFLLLFHCNYRPILYRFRDVTIYWSKICFFVIFTTPVSFEATAREGFS